ncbi:hypothetical protein DUC20_21135 [Salmonella enterica subsp. salamae]|nr:hypothetical protein [Salmonella enterica subsp. salamae]
MLRNRVRRQLLCSNYRADLSAGSGEFHQQAAFLLNGASALTLIPLVSPFAVILSNDVPHL